MLYPVRIQRKRTRGWKMPENTVYVGRPTIWGNPFIADEAQLAVDAYRKLISRACTVSFEMGPRKLQLARDATDNTLHWAYSEWVHENIESLRGKNLACWCKLNEPCHADVLLEMANKEEE